jgi:hypothetical protein
MVREMACLHVNFHLFNNAHLKQSSEFLKESRHSLLARHRSEKSSETRPYISLPSVDKNIVNSAERHPVESLRKRNYYLQA